MRTIENIKGCLDCRTLQSLRMFGTAFFNSSSSPNPRPRQPGRQIQSRADHILADQPTRDFSPQAPDRKTLTRPGSLNLRRG
jgi:hypothetical protein